MLQIQLYFITLCLALPKCFRLSLVRYWRYGISAQSVGGDIFKRAPLLLCPTIAMYNLIPGDIISEAIALNGFYDWTHTKIMAREAARNKDGMFVDVGANLGYFSFLWAGLAPQGRVVAFEASPRNISMFQFSIERNCLGRRIALIPKALGDCTGSVAFDIGPEEQSGWGGLSNEVSSNAITVPIVRLDDELPDQRIDLLKVDVEGAEALVLLGCEKLLRKRMINTIYFEQNQERMNALGFKEGDVQKFLRTMGYECRPIDASGAEWIACPKP
jgi:FkbM family methyltransferase